MVDILSMVDLTSISALLAAIGVIVGVVFAVLELRNLTKVRKTDLIIRLSPWFHIGGIELTQMWNTVAHLDFKDYDDFVKKYGEPGDGTKPASLAIIVIGNFFNGLGILMQRKLMDINLIQAYFPVRLAWEKLEPIVKGFRKQSNWLDWLEYFEYLYNEIQKREQPLLQTQQ